MYICSFIIIYLMNGHGNLEQTAGGKAGEKRKGQDQTGKTRWVLPQSLTTHFAALVLGGFTPLHPEAENHVNLYVIIFGGLMTIIWANIGNKILK